MSQAKTIGDVLRDRGLREGSPEWSDAAAEILCGPAEWARLKRLHPAQIESELGRVDRTKS